MQSRQVTFGALAAGVLAGAVGFAQNGTPIDPNSNNTLTIAVDGDLPYGLRRTIRHKRTRRGLRRGHTRTRGSISSCTWATSIRKQDRTEAYDQQIADFWTAFKNPMVYTPGDNEWSDCHKTAKGGSVHATADRYVTTQRQPRRLRGRRSGRQPRSRAIDLLPDPGYTLGGRQQAGALPGADYDPATRRTPSTSRT